MTSRQRSIDIAAAPERVWQVISDVAAWPQWTASMSSVRRLDDGPLRVGTRTQIKQPGLPTLVWEVIELQENARFVWVAKSPGVATTATHEITADGDSCRLKLTVNWTGPMAGLIGALMGKRTDRFLAQETEGAKARVESG